MRSSSTSSPRRLLVALGVVASLAACSGSSDGEDGEDAATPLDDAGSDPDDLVQENDSIETGAANGDPGSESGSSGSDPEESSEGSEDSEQTSDGENSVASAEIGAALGDGEVLSAAELSPDGSAVAVAVAAATAADARVVIHDASDGSVTSTVTLPGIPEVLDLLWWTGGLSMVSSDLQIVTVDPATGEVVTTVPIDQCSLSDAVEFDANAGVLYTWSGGAELCRLDVATGEELRLPSPDGVLIEHAALNADGSLLALSSSDQDFVGTFELHDTTTLEPTGEFLDVADGAGPVWGFDDERFVSGSFPAIISPDGIELATGGVPLVSASGDLVVTVETGDVGDASTYRVFDLDDGAPLAAFTADAREWTLSASRDGSRLVVGDVSTGITRVFDL